MQPDMKETNYSLQESKSRLVGKPPEASKGVLSLFLKDTGKQEQSFVQSSNTAVSREEGKCWIRNRPKRLPQQETEGGSTSEIAL